MEMAGLISVKAYSLFQLSLGQGLLDGGQCCNGLGRLDLRHDIQALILFTVQSTDSHSKVLATLREEN